MQRYAMLYGVYLGIFWIVGAIFFPLGLNNPLLFFLFIGFVVCGPFLAFRYVRTYRNVICGGTISFFHAWTFSVLVYMFAALLAAAAHYIYFRFIDKGYIIDTYSSLMDDFFAQASSVDGLGVYKGQMEHALEQFSMLTPIEVTMQLFSNNIFWGILLAVPTALFVMKKRPSASQRK